MPPHLDTALRDRVAKTPLDFVEEALGPFRGDELRQYRPLIEAAQVAADEARATLHRWVEAGRRAGLSWGEIGKLLGVSKQAAQQRFSPRGADAVPFGRIAVTPGIGAATEDELLAAEGAAGRELVETDAGRLLFRQTSRVWQHRRSVGPLDADVAAADGWVPAAQWFVFHYYKRPA